MHIILEKLSGDVPNWVAAILAGVFGAITVYFAFRLDRKQKQSSRTEKINACWTAIAVDFRNSADLATVFFDKEIMAPLYRLPDDLYTTSVAELLKEGGIKVEEMIELSAFFHQVETLNRGLDRVRQGPMPLPRENERNRMKAAKIRQGGEFYLKAAHVLNSRLGESDFIKVNRLLSE